MLFDEVKSVVDLFPQIATRAEVVQLMKHASECKLDKVKWPVAGEVKEDGNYCFVLVLDGKHYAFGRSGLRFTNLGFIESQFAGCSNGVFMGEVVNDKLELEQLSGVISPNRVNPLEADIAQIHAEHTTMRLFDYILPTNLVAGISTVPYTERRAQLTAANKTNFTEIPYELLHSELEMEAHARELIRQGKEGGCYKVANSDWRAGRRDYHSMKIVKEVSFDLECIRVEDGKGKRLGIVANMFFRWRNGKELKADLGKGWTDAKRLEAYENPPIGRVFRVTAMGDSSSNGLLRKAKVQEERFDKKADY